MKHLQSSSVTMPSTAAGDASMVTTTATWSGVGITPRMLLAFFVFEVVQ
jgi:hypothetical protein